MFKFNRLRTVAVTALLTIATYASAVDTADPHPDTYVVREGDTLWDIATRFLDKPWLWPEIWQANPQLSNPHLIYPGDVLSLAYLNQSPQIGIQAGPRQEAPLNAIPLAAIEPFLKNLRVTDEFKQLPHVTGFEDNHLRGAAGQLAYVVGLTDARPGQRYAFVRPTLRYNQPKPSDDLDMRGNITHGTGNLWKDYLPPNERRELLGYELAQVNIGMVTRTSSDTSEVASVLLQDTGHEVRAGDRLIPIEAQSYDLQFVPHAPAPAAVEAGLRVLAVTDTLNASGPRDVIAISGGSREGIDNGTVFSIWRQGNRINDRIGHSNFSRADDGYTGSKRSTVGLPDEYAAHAMVFRTFEKVSYALVMEAVKPTAVGYQLKHPDAQ